MGNSLSSAACGGVQGRAIASASRLKEEDGRLLRFQNAFSRLMSYIRGCLTCVIRVTNTSKNGRDFLYSLIIPEGCLAALRPWLLCLIKYEHALAIFHRNGQSAGPWYSCCGILLQYSSFLLLGKNTSTPPMQSENIKPSLRFQLLG